MSAVVGGPQAQEDFASEATAAVIPPAPSASSTASSTAAPSAPDPALPPAPHGVCVSCGRQVTLRRVVEGLTHHTYQWVPDDEPVRPGKHCSEAALPAFHWAQDATAAVYRVAV